MSLDKNEPKDIFNQVKEILSGLGDFLPTFPGPDPVEGEEGAKNWGQLSQVVIAFKCHHCASMHLLAFTPEKFIEVFAGRQAKGYFENFTAIGMFQAGLPEDIEKKIEEYEQATDGLQTMIEKTKALADRVTIENSHLKVENDALKRELDRLKRGGEQYTETALDFRPSRPRFKFSFGIKKEGQN